VFYVGIICLKIGLSNLGKKETVLTTCTTSHFPSALFAGLRT